LRPDRKINKLEADNSTRHRNYDSIFARIDYFKAFNYADAL